jgi:hypothetical protein
MSLHLAEIARAVAPGAHAVLLLDQAGWHLSDKLVVPANITQGLRMKIARVFDGMEFGVVRGVFLRSGDPHVGKDFGGRILGLGRPSLWRQDRAPAD